jgi:DNA-binding XRE family transcriptional regulator
MSINFNDFYQEIPKKRKAKIEKKVKQELKAIQLSEVRGLVAMTQKELAENIDISQAAISKMEKQSDLNISTLRKLIEGVGGQLDVIVKLPNKTQVKLKTFSSIDREGS